MMIFFQQINPGRTAGRKHRQTFRTLCKAFDKLGSLFNNRQVGAEIGVKNLFETHAAQNGIGFAGQILAEIVTELFADGHANRRRNLHNGIQVFVIEHVPYFFGFVIFDNRAGRTMRRTLAAFDAGAVRQINAACGGNPGGQTAVQIAQSPNVLLILADLDATAADNALGRVQHNRLG